MEAGRGGRCGSPLASSSNSFHCHLCLSGWPLDKLRDGPGPDSGCLRPADSEFPYWHGLPFCICTWVHDLVRGGTRAGVRFCFYLNHRQGKSELFCLVQGPTHRLFFPSETAKLGDISRLHSPGVFHLHMIHSCSEIDQCCHMNRTKKRQGSGLMFRCCYAILGEHLQQY